MTTTAVVWDGDDLSLAVWSALGGMNFELDEQPEQVIDRLRRNGYNWETACSELGISPDMRRELAVAGAWAGIARVALRRRDDAIRACVAAGASARQVGRAVRLTHPGVQRVVDRGASPRGRW